LSFVLPLWSLLETLVKTIGNATGDGIRTIRGPRACDFDTGGENRLLDQIFGLRERRLHERVLHVYAEGGGWWRVGPHFTVVFNVLRERILIRWRFGATLRLLLVLVDLINGVFWRNMSSFDILIERFWKHGRLVLGYLIALATAVLCILY